MSKRRFWKYLEPEQKATAVKFSSWREIFSHQLVERRIREQRQREEMTCEFLVKQFMEKQRGWGTMWIERSCMTKKKKLVCDKRKNDDFPCKTFFFLKLGWEIEGVSAASCSFPSQRGSNELSLWKCSTWNTQDQTNAGVRKAIHGCQTVRNVRTAP